MEISGVFMDSTWSHDLGFSWSWSEAQKGAEDKGLIKALVGGLPMTPIHCHRVVASQGQEDLTRNKPQNDVLEMLHNTFFWSGGPDVDCSNNDYFYDIN